MAQGRSSTAAESVFSVAMISLPASQHNVAAARLQEPSAAGSISFDGVGAALGVGCAIRRAVHRLCAVIRASNEPTYLREFCSIRLAATTFIIVSGVSNDKADVPMTIVSTKGKWEGEEVA